MKIFQPVPLFCFYLIFLFQLPAQEQLHIAVMDLDAEGISKSENKIISERLRTNLFGTGKFIILERQKMQDILNEQGFQISGCTSNECVVEIGKIIGVQKMVAGSIGKLGSLYTINLRLIDVETGIVNKTAIEDCRCTIEQVLTQATNRAALKLAGTDIPTAEKKSQVTISDPQEKELIKKQPEKPQKSSYSLRPRKSDPKMSMGLALGGANYNFDDNFLVSGNPGLKTALKSNFEFSFGYQLNSYLKVSYFFKTHLVDDSGSDYTGDYTYSGNLLLRGPKFQIFFVPWIYLSYSYVSATLKLEKDNQNIYDPGADENEEKKSVSMYSLGLDAPVHRNWHLTVDFSLYKKYFSYMSGILFLF